MGIFVSKALKKLKQPTTEYHYSSSHRKKRAMSESVALHRAALKGDWDGAEELFRKKRGLMRTPITEGGEIALHIAAVEGHQHFVSKLVDMMETDDLETVNAKGCTALCFAAAAGHTQIARIMLDKSPLLATIKGEDKGVRPLYMAALQGFREMADYLYLHSRFESWTPQEKINVLTSAIDSELYDLSIRIVGEDKSLVVAEDEHGVTPLQVLAQNPLAFACNNGHSFWRKIIRCVVGGAKRQDMDARPYELLECLWDAAESYEEDVETAQAVDSSKLFFVAAESGNDDFLVELLKKDHNLLYKVNSSTHSIFHIAVLHRYVKVFNLMYELVGTKDLIATYIDDEGNNLLHLAAKLAPPNQLNSIPGAALQMQREVLWFKEVEKLVRASYRNKKNFEGQTPHELFLAEHRELMREGEKFMKQTAKSCMLVTMLIATVVFTTAFTVPGGYDNSSGVPILEKRRMFVVFPVSEAVATLASLTSMLMFLSILTSRYSDEDFLKTLPFWLVVGVGALFLSIVAMMVAFCTCLLFFEHGWAAVTLLLVFFGSVPTMFVVLKYPLLITILRCTYSCTWLFRSYNRLHS